MLCRIYAFVLAVIIFLLGGNNSASFMAGLSGAIVEIVSGLTSGCIGKHLNNLQSTTNDWRQPRNI